MSSDMEWTPTKEARMLRLVRIQHKRLRNAIRQVNMHLRLTRPAAFHVRANLGHVNRSIYRYGAVAIQNDRITRLPAEVQEMVWSHLTVPADRTAFGLTCKSNAAMFDTLKHQDLYHRRLKTTTKIHKLAVLVRLRDWPGLRGYNLCYQCVTYLKGNKRGWGGDSQVLRDGLATPAAMITGPRCNECVLRAKLDLVREHARHKEYVNLSRQTRRVDAGAIPGRD